MLQKCIAILDLSLISLIPLKNTFGKFSILLIPMEQFLTKFLKDKTYRILFLLFKIYFILYTVNVFYSMKS